jgi:AraC-like DNA-binding protein
VKLGTVIKSVPGPLPADWRTVEALFDHMPDTVFFVKDAEGRYAAVNATLVKRCGLRFKSELLGRRPADIFPGELGHQPTAQDRRVLKTGRSILDRLELHWYALGKLGWCLTTKLPLLDESGKTCGLVGISRDLRTPGERDNIPASLVDTLQFLEERFTETISPAELARRAGLSPFRFARLIKRIFRLTTGQLITQTRLAAATHLLTETDRGVADIALACGFYDHSAFTRAFRSATGMTPTQFRRR